MQHNSASALYEDAVHARNILETWLPYLLKSGFQRKELERLDVGHIFMLSCRINNRLTPYPLTDVNDRLALIEATRASTL